LEGDGTGSPSLLDLDGFCTPGAKNIEIFSSLQIQDFVFPERKPSI
jgi:hypothetical protein